MAPSLSGVGKRTERPTVLGLRGLVNSPLDGDRQTSSFNSVADRRGRCPRAASVTRRRACATVGGMEPKPPVVDRFRSGGGGARDRSIPTLSHFHPNAALRDPGNAQKLGTAVTA